MSESIYNIIPKEDNPPPKGPIYKSKYPPSIPPTGSTFGHHTTSKPIVIHILFSNQISTDNSQEALKLIHSMLQLKPLVTSKAIENHLLKTLWKNIQALWVTKIFLPSENTHTTGIGKKIQSHVIRISPSWDKGQIETSLLLTPLKIFFQLPKELQNKKIG